MGSRPTSWGPRCCLTKLVNLVILKKKSFSKCYKNHPRRLPRRHRGAMRPQANAYSDVGAHLGSHRTSQPFFLCVLRLPTSEFAVAHRSIAYHSRSSPPHPSLSHSPSPCRTTGFPSLVQSSLSQLVITAWKKRDGSASSMKI